MRLIDADALIDEIDRLNTWVVNDYGYCLEDKIVIERKQVECLIEEAPTVKDVVQVVMCKDCEQWKRNIGIADSPNGHCFYLDIEMNGCDFCSYGERRGEGE